MSLNILMKSVTLVTLVFEENRFCFWKNNDKNNFLLFVEIAIFSILIIGENCLVSKKKINKNIFFILFFVADIAFLFTIIIGTNCIASLETICWVKISFSLLFWYAEISLLLEKRKVLAEITVLFFISGNIKVRVSRQK